MRGTNPQIFFENFWGDSLLFYIQKIIYKFGDGDCAEQKLPVASFARGKNPWVRRFENIKILKNLETVGVEPTSKMDPNKSLRV